jgi:hypothetical protein
MTDPRLPGTARSLLHAVALAFVVAIASPPAAAIDPPARAAAPAKPAGGVRELEWEELLPEDARSRFAATPPPAAHDYLGEGGLAAQQVMDFSINKALDGASVKLPGFIVPLDVGKDGLVSEFFLVPYFGACIHVPPPPPNQIVFAAPEEPIEMTEIWAAYWVYGKIEIKPTRNSVAQSHYVIDVEKVEPWE